MEWYVVGLMMIAILVLVLLLGVPLAAVLGLTAFAFLAIETGVEGALLSLNAQLVYFWTHYSVLAVPLFIVMAEALFVSGVTNDIFDMASKWFRGLPGGLAVVTVISCAAFGALSGSALGAVATFGLLAVPEMIRRGYDKRLATGSVVAAGPLATLIPPSIMALLYAMLLEISAGQQLMAGLIPGVILAGGYVAVVAVWAWVNPNLCPKEPAASWTERLVVLRKIITPLLIVVTVLGGIYSGIATVTEAAALGALASILFAVASRRATWRKLLEALMRAARTTSFILFIAVGGKFFGWVLNYYMVPHHIVKILLATGWNRWIIMGMIQLLWIIMGCFVDPVGILFTTVPILHPIILAFDFNLTWFGVLFLINMEIAAITPPMGLSLYIMKGILGDQVKLSEIIFGGLRFNIADVIVLGLVMAFPILALWLPNMMVG